MKSAVVIGSGFGGLALAIRLQAAGIQTTIIEARDKPGGRAYYWERDGFIFDGGPTVITDPPCLTQLWALTGHDMAQDVELIPVMPFYRLNWSDGTNFDYSNDEAKLRSEIAKLNPADVEGYAKFLEYSAGVHDEGYVKLGTKAFLDFASMIKAAPALAKYQAWRSVYSMVSSFVKNEKLREALSFHTLLVGGNPMKTSAIYALIHKLEKDGGVWFAKGGTNRLVAAWCANLNALAARCGLAILSSGSKHKASVQRASSPNPVIASNAMLSPPTAISCTAYRDLLGYHPGAAKRLQPACHARNSHPACLSSILASRAAGPVSRTI